MIRTIFACCLTLSFGTHPAIAQQMSTFNWGYLYAQKVVFDDSLDDLNGIGTWTHIDWDMGTQITPSVALVGGVGGFTAKNSFFFSEGLSLVSGNIDVTTVSVPVHARVFLNDAAQTTRAFVDVGPSLNFQIYKVSFSLPGFDEEVDKKKLGALVGLGIVFGKKPWRFVVRTRYHWIDKHGEFDASNFQFTIGSVWGRSKK